MTLHEGVLEILYERHAIALYQQDICCDNGAEELPNIEDDGQ